MEFDLDTREIEQWRGKVAGVDTIVRDELTTGVQRAGLAVQRGAQEVARVDQGTMRRSLTTKVEPFSGGVRALVGTNVPHGVVMDKGRRAGAPMPPQGTLLGWMRRRGIPAEAEFVIRRAIARRGIRGDRWLTGTFARMRPQINQETRQVSKRVIARLRSGS